MCELMNTIFFSKFPANVDYFPVAAQITFPAGSGPFTALESVLNPINDSRVEGNENVQLSASISQGSGSFTSNGDSANIVILDDDRELNFLSMVNHSHRQPFATVEIVIGFQPLTYQVTEAQGSVVVSFVVTENNVLDIPASATLNTQIGTAICMLTIITLLMLTSLKMLFFNSYPLAPADFTALVNEVVDLPIGTMLGSQFSRTITIESDNLPENGESFQVLLSSTSTAVSIDPALETATVNILGDSKHKEIMRHGGLKINLYQCRDCIRILTKHLQCQ